MDNNADAKKILTASQTEDWKRRGLVILGLVGRRQS